MCGAADDYRRRVGTDELHHASDVVAFRDVLLVRTFPASLSTVHQGVAIDGTKYTTAIGDERRYAALVQLDQCCDIAFLAAYQFFGGAEDL